MKISRKSLFYFTTLLASLNFSSANAGTVSVIFDAGTLQDTSAITNSATTGAMMDGMNIGVTYADNSMTSATWTAASSTGGAAQWSGGFLSLVGDSFSNSWNLSADKTGFGITSILLDAGLGGSLFDTTFGGAFGTDGSARGTDFTVTSGGDPYDITATYSGLIGVAGAAAVGDIYRYLHIDFGQTAFIGQATSALRFLQDTDNLADISPVPVPAAAWLFGSALLGFFGFSRRKANV